MDDYIRMSIGEISVTEADRQYITMAALERQQDWKEFVREALIEYAAR